MMVFGYIWLAESFTISFSVLSQVLEVLFSLFQDLGSWGRAKRARKKRGRTKARICSRLSVVGDNMFSSLN